MAIVPPPICRELTSKGRKWMLQAFLHMQSAGWLSWLDLGEVTHVDRDPRIGGRCASSGNPSDAVYLQGSPHIDMLMIEEIKILMKCSDVSRIRANSTACHIVVFKTLWPPSFLSCISNTNTVLRTKAIMPLSVRRATCPPRRGNY